MGGLIKETPNNQMINPSCSSSEFRSAVFGLQDYMMTELSDFHVEPLVEHYFADGMYGRKMTIEKGVTIVGKIHKHSHVNVISQGIIDVYTEFGTVRYEAPITFVSNPLTKRVVRAIEKTVWTTVHVTNETDLEKIEAEVIAENYNGIEGGGV